jgi:adenylosuccinate lyase
MDVFGGVIFSQAVLLKLVEHGVSREDAYRMVQNNAMKAWNREDGNFKENLLNDQDVSKLLSREELLSCFDADAYLKNLDQVFARLGV